MPIKPSKANEDAADRAFATAVGHHQAGRLEQAEKAYNEVLKIDWANGDALRLLGGLYIQLEQPVRAATTLKQALQVLPNNAEIPNNLGIALRNQGKLQDAVEQFENALRLKADYAEAFNNLGHAYFTMGRLNTAVALYEKALKAKPDYLKAICNIGAALRELGRYAESAEQLQAGLKKYPKDPDLLHDMGLTLQKQGKLDEAVAVYKQALAQRPNFFSALNNYGSALRELGDSNAAQVEYEKALALAPNRVETLINLAAVFWDLNSIDKAIECYERALKIDENAVEALVNLGSVLWVQGKAEESRAKYEAALRIKPDHASAYANLGSLLHDKADLDGALGMYEKALRIDPEHPHARFAKGLALLAYGQYNEGWMLYEAGLGKRMLRGVNSFKSKPWNGTAKPGKRLVIWSEQGLGDSLQFVRYAPMCKERVGKVIVLCPKPLQRLFKNCPGIDDVQLTINGDEFDEQVAMMSLPYVFGTTLDNVPNKVPYLFVDKAAQDKWSPRFAGIKQFKVGLVWAGNARETQANANLLDRRRSVHLETLKPLLDMPNIQFVSLQMGPTAPQIKELGLTDRIIDPMPEVTDFVDTAAIIQNLDLVISVDTSVAHLVGGLGKPIWILSRYDSCWRWLRNREDSPWYPTARIFGQPSFGAWDPVVARVCDALAATVARHNESAA